MKKKEWTGLVTGLAGYTGIAYAGLLLQRKILPGMTPAGRAFAVIAVTWFGLLVPAVIAFLLRDKPREYGFAKEHLWKQVLIGIAMGLITSTAMMFVPYLLGAGYLMDNGQRYLQVWDFLENFGYCILATALVEETVFRGFAWTRLKRIGWPDWAALAGTSAAFGLAHLLAGNGIQAVVTGLYGALLCFCRMKIKNCTTLSLILCHGIHDAMISVFSCLLF